MRYGNLLIEGKVTTHGSTVDAVNADDLLFELGGATTGDANGGSISFKPGIGAGAGTNGYISLLPSENAVGGTTALRFYDIDSTAYVGFKAADTVTSTTVWTLPAADGTADYMLKTDGAGNLSWSAPTNAYLTIDGNSGTATADLTNDTLSIVGVVGIDVVVSDTADDDTVSISFVKTGINAKTTPVLADQIVLFDSAASDAPVYTTFTQAFNSLNVVYGISANGMLVRTADDTYASRTITASVVAGEEGVSVTNGDGVAGDPTVGLDINSLTNGSVTIDTVIPTFDGTNNVKVTPAEIVSSRILRGTFVDGDLTTGSLAIEHALAVSTVLVQIFDEANQMVLPDTLTLTDDNTTTVDLTSYGTLAGTWSYIIFG